MKKVLIRLLVVGIATFMPALYGQYPVTDAGNTAQAVQQVSELEQQLSNLKQQLSSLDNILHVNTDDMVATKGILNTVGTAQSIWTKQDGGLMSFLNSNTGDAFKGSIPAEAYTEGGANPSGMDSFLSGFSDTVGGFKTIMGPLSKLTSLFGSQSQQLFGITQGAGGVTQLLDSLAKNPSASQGTANMGVAQNLNIQLVGEADANAKQIADYQRQLDSLQTAAINSTTLQEQMAVNNQINLLNNELTKKLIEESTKRNVNQGVNQYSEQDLAAIRLLRDRSANLAESIK